MCPCVMLHFQSCADWLEFFLCTVLISKGNACVCVHTVCVTTCHHYPQPPTDQGVRRYFNFSFGRRNKNNRTWIQFPVSHLQSNHVDLNNRPIQSQIFPPCFPYLLYIFLFPLLYHVVSLSRILRIDL